MLEQFSVVLNYMISFRKQLMLPEIPSILIKVKSLEYKLSKRVHIALDLELLLRTQGFEYHVENVRKSWNVTIVYLDLRLFLL